MLFSKNKIQAGQQKLSKILPVLEGINNFCYVGAGLTRLKIIFLLRLYKELCPTDFSKILHISISAASHQLKLFERLGLVKKMRMGQIICYKINNENPIAKQLIKLLKERR